MGEKRAKSEDLALPVRLIALAVIERTALEPKGRDRAHASSARVLCIALAAIASRLRHGISGAITSARSQCLQSSANMAALECNTCDRAHPRDLTAHYFVYK
jgi:hypothetical protein